MRSLLQATAIVGALALVPVATSAMAEVDTDSYRELDTFMDVFNRVKANRLVFTGGKLSGEVGDPIVDAMAKHDALIEVRDELGLGREDVMAIGDGANDRLMIKEAGLGIAFRAKPALIEVADAELRHHGLDALLWVQGVRRRDWFRN